MVQSQYGWLDATVLDLPICRLRQIVATIEQRMKHERKYTEMLTEWQTRTTVQFIARSVPLEKGQKNPLAEMADAVRLTEDDPRPQSTTPPEVFVEQGSQVASNPAGSFEALARGFR